MNKNENRLLVIEDNLYIGGRIVDATEKINGIKSIQHSKSLKEAFSFLNKTSFEIITLDLSLPDGNGIEILKWLKKNENKNKVLVFSANTELKQTCLKHGALAFFDKAEGFNDLIETIKCA